MIYILIGAIGLVIGFGIGYFVQIKWGHREKTDGILLINHQLHQVNLNVNRDIEDLETDDILTIKVKYADGEQDIIVREENSNGRQENHKA